jgi:RNA polymerase sigma-70 factor (ECF subfamily)
MTDTLHHGLLLGLTDARAASADDLLGRQAAGDRRALRPLYDRYAPRALALARGIVGAGDAEEIVQDTFVAVWRRAGEYDPRRGSVAGWISTIARSRAIDRLRSRQSAQRTADAAAAEPEAAALTALDEVEARLERDRVRAALAELPAEQRSVIELAYYAGRTHVEIASETGDPLGTVKSRVRLAMAKLAALLGPRRRST